MVISRSHWDRRSAGSRREPHLRPAKSPGGKSPLDQSSCGRKPLKLKGRKVQLECLDSLEHEIWQKAKFGVNASASTFAETCKHSIPSEPI